MADPAAAAPIPDEPPVVPEGPPAQFDPAVAANAANRLLTPLTPNQEHPVLFVLVGTAFSR
jgi:hypothetical protein